MLSIYSLDESEKWASIVKSFKDYDVYYLPEYSKAFEIHGDGRPTLIYYFDEDIRAINVVMKRDIGQDKKFAGKIKTNFLFDFATPYGYGGFIFEGQINEKNLNRFNEIYIDYCIKNNIVSEFVRFHPIINNSIDNKNVYDVVDLGNTITMNLNSKEQIWEDLSSKNRNVIRKAIKSGVKIYWARSPELIDKFIPLYNSTMNKDEATDYYYFSREFYQSVVDDLKHNSLFFYAVHNNKIIAMSIIMFGNKNMHYHLSASDREYQSLAATNLLLYEAACWGCENGYKAFHLGGGLGSKEDSLYKFKKAFNKKENLRFSIGRKVFNQELYYEIIEIRENEKEFDGNTSFFPVYRQ